ncbi:GNAT family N-acetyltransferase [Jeotgalibacillus proteolyticus]|uniref:N-acetyltransferase n=1 Tax=Jeotgalibacillus proteolyticus TaxID=2082395 RepID=A0A2S5GEG9_9BACL|nr:GNAT family N-acetyltransferase [Jeotgalibacillus proteolyticus]PPA71305.1 N-acetyltransferase [Jeotgalibacillus proteolyticus]
MLIRYKKSFEKIAMGLMSFMPTEKDIKQLQLSMKMYEEDKSNRLFLWKEEDIIGLVGVKITDDSILIQHISVSPSHRNEGIGKKMISTLREMYPDMEFSSTSYTEGFLSKCVNDEPSEIKEADKENH